MNTGVFVIKDDGKLVEMKSQNYSIEKDFQKQIADYPNLLAGDQVDSESPRRWLLIEGKLWGKCWNTHQTPRFIGPVRGFRHFLKKTVEASSVNPTNSWLNLLD